MTSPIPEPTDPGTHDTVPVPGPPPGRQPRQRPPTAQHEPPPLPGHHRPAPAAIRRPPRKALRHPAVGLSATVLFGLLAAFFGWQAAAPLWLAVGVGAEGAAIPTRGLHLRWTIGLALVLACGAGIAWATGAFRLEPARSRRRAVLLSFAGPLLLTIGFLAAAL